jgi:hypothetical protein
MKWRGQPVVSLFVVLMVRGVLAEPAFADVRALARARQAYNDGNHTAAIVAALEARTDARVADSATIVMARAYLERFRNGADRQDLESAREALQSVAPARLAPRDRLDLAVGLAETLYLEGAYGAAAEMFEPLLHAATDLGPRARERVLDWWASAIDAQARTRPLTERPPYYRRIVDEMELELKQDAGLGAASYWLAAASLGMGDVQRAWQAAIAGWVRASFAADGGSAVRQDLDRLVVEAIIPDRIRLLALPAREVPDATLGLTSEWDLVKQRWK